MGDDGGGELGQDDGDAVALGDAGGFQPVGEAVGQLGELAKCVSLDCAIKLLVNQSRLPSRLPVAAVDAEVVANGDAPLEVPLDLVDFAPAVALEQLRDPPCAASVYGADRRRAGAGRKGSKPTEFAARVRGFLQLSIHRPGEDGDLQRHRPDRVVERPKQFGQSLETVVQRVDVDAQLAGSFSPVAEALVVEIQGLQERRALTVVQPEDGSQRAVDEHLKAGATRRFEQRS